MHKNIQIRKNLLFFAWFPYNFYDLDRPETILSPYGHRLTLPRLGTIVKNHILSNCSLYAVALFSIAQTVILHLRIISL